MLTGEYNYAIDTKGRVTIPQKYREDLGDRLYITKGLDGCLFVLSEQQWKEFESKIGDLPLSKRAICSVSSFPVPAMWNRTSRGVC